MGLVLTGSAIAQETAASAENVSVSSDPFQLHDLESNRDPNAIFAKPGETPEVLGQLEQLQYAADSGNEIAMWQLGRYYADQAKTTDDHVRAFELFRKLVAAEGDHSPYSPRAPYLANAMNWLGIYYREGIPGSTIQKNRSIAWRMFYTAGNLYRNRDALFSLSEMCDGADDIHCTPKQGARWLNLAAEKGHVGAQARLGHRLFEGDGVRRSQIQGLTWLTIARERANAVRDVWVSELHESAFSIADAEIRRLASERAERWISNHCSDASIC